MRRFIAMGFMLAGSIQLCAADNDPNILVYDEGSIQVNSTVDAYDQLTPGSPIKGSIMITRGSKDKVDAKSFHMGNLPITVEFTESQSFSSYGNSLAIDIYRFQVKGVEAGSHTLPPITVKIDGRTYSAPPLTVQITDPIP